MAISRLAPALAALLVLAPLGGGCGGGGEIKKATQPNGPPVPPPPPPPRLDTPTKKQEAIQKAAAFAQPKFKTRLAYDQGTAQFLSVERKIEGARNPDGSFTADRPIAVPLGSWRVIFPVSKNAAASVDSVESTTSLEEWNARGSEVLALEFIVQPDGTVKEGNVRLKPPLLAAPK